MYCKICGQKLADNAEFCGGCGISIKTLINNHNENDIKSQLKDENLLYTCQNIRNENAIMELKKGVLRNIVWAIIAFAICTQRKLGPIYFDSDMREIVKIAMYICIITIIVRICEMIYYSSKKMSLYIYDDFIKIQTNDNHYTRVSYEQIIAISKAKDVLKINVSGKEISAYCDNAEKVYEIIMCKMNV